MLNIRDLLMLTVWKKFYFFQRIHFFLLTKQKRSFNLASHAIFVILNLKNGENGLRVKIFARKTNSESCVHVTQKNKFSEAFWTIRNLGVPKKNAKVRFWERFKPFKNLLPQNLNQTVRISPLRIFFHVILQGKG